MTFAKTFQSQSYEFDYFKNLKFIFMTLTCFSGTCLIRTGFTKDRLKRLDEIGATGVWVSWNAYVSIIELNLLGSSKSDSWILKKY